jgi:hypothetical protein
MIPSTVVPELRLPLLSLRVAATIALHGVVDLAYPATLFAYAGVLLPSRPAFSTHDSLLFAVASVIHFARDSSMTESLLLHILLVVMARFVNVRWAMMLMYAHFLLVHLPKLWFQAFEEPRPIEAVLLVVAFLGAILFPGTVCKTALDADLEDRSFVLSYRLQRVVVCHVVAKILR